MATSRRPSQDDGADLEKAAQAQIKTAKHVEGFAPAVDKMLNKKEAESVKRDAAFNEQMRKIEATFTAKGEEQSKGTQVLVDRLKDIQKNTSNGKATQAELSTQNQRLQNVVDTLQHADNISGTELKEMEELVQITRDSIKEQRSDSLAFRALSTATEKIMANSIDITAVASGLLTNSPLITFVSKNLMDMGKGLLAKRKAVREERQSLLAESLEEHQKEAYKQREKLAEEQKKVDEEKAKPETEKPKKEPKKKPEPKGETKKKPEPKEVRPPVVETPEVDPMPDIQMDIPPEMMDYSPRQEEPLLMESESDSETLPELTEMTEEQKLTNLLIKEQTGFVEKFVNFLLYEAADDTEEKREEQARDEKRNRLLSRKDGKDTKTPSEGGFFSKLMDNIPGVGMLKGAIASIGTFLTATLIPAITAMVTGFIAVLPAIIAVGAIVAIVATFVKGFMSAGDILGKEDPSVMERIIAGLGNMYETILGIGDWIFGLMGFETDMKGWFNEHITRPVAEFMETLNIGEMLGDVWDIIKAAPERIMEGVRASIAWVEGVGETIDGMIHAIVDPVVDLFTSIGEWITDTFDVSDEIAAIMESLNIVGLINKMKDAILKYIPDFLLTDEQEKRKAALTGETYVDKDAAQNFVKEQNKAGTVDYNRYGKSKIDDWEAVERMTDEQKSKLIAFDDWDDTTKKRLNASLADSSPKGTPTVAPSTDQPTGGEPVIAMDASQQPVAMARSERTENITVLDNLVKEFETQQAQAPIATPASGSVSSTVNSSSVHIPAAPQNQERGIRDLQKAFAV